MESPAGPWVALLAGGGVITGLWLLARGLGTYRSTAPVADTSTSSIGSIAAGEVRVSGVIEAAELSLVSLLQSVPCIYYRATVEIGGDAPAADRGYTEERAVGFRVRDGSGTLRVFPRGARVDAPLVFSGETGLTGDEPAGLHIRPGGSTVTTESERAVAVAALLATPVTDPPAPWAALRERRGRRRYRETRLEPGDQVTIVGRALPFADLSDPANADRSAGADIATDDPEVAADLAEARAAGVLADDPAEAWGNAAIAGFGIGRPVSPPTLDPGADRLPLATREEADRMERTFDIDPEALVLAASAEVPLLIAYGSPGAVVGRGRTALVAGLLGAVLAIVSAMALAIDLDGRFGR